MPTRTRPDRLAAWSQRSGLPIRQARPEDLEPPAPAQWNVPGVTYAGSGELTFFAEVIRMAGHPHLYELWQLTHTLGILARKTYDAHTQPNTDESAIVFYDAALEMFLSLPEFTHLRSWDCDTCHTAVFVRADAAPNPFTQPCPTCGG